MATISDFKNNFKGGVRANLFQIAISSPATGMLDLRFLGKAADIPASTIANIPVPFRGRNLPVPGDRTFAPWTVTVLNDPDWAYRTAFENWMHQISNHSQNKTSLNASDIYGQAVVSQLNREGGVIRTYRLHDIMPTEVSAIALTMDAASAVEEFTVAFEVSNITIDGAGMDGSSSGDGVDISITGSVNVGGVSISGGINL